MALDSGHRWTWLFFFLALLVYAPGIWWGLPKHLTTGLPFGTDELGGTSAIKEIYAVFLSRHPVFNPQYPLFQYIVQIFFVAPYYASLWLTGHLSYPAPTYPYGLDHPTFELGVLTLLARSASWLMAAGTVAIAFRTGEALRDRRTGVLAATFVLLLYPMFYYSRTSNVDAGALFWTALGLCIYARILMDGESRKRWYGFGLCAALATATKDPSYAAFLSTGAVLVCLRVVNARRSGRDTLQAMRLPLMAAGLALVAYLVASGLVFRPRRYFRHLYFITHGSAGGVFLFRYPPTLSGYASMVTESANRMLDAMGAPMLICAVVGLVLWLTRERRLLLWVIPAVAVYFGVIFPVRFTLLRFVLIIAYVLAFCAADVVARGWEHRSEWRRAAARLAGVLVIVWGVIRGGDLTYQMLRDSRYASARWLAVMTRPGDRVGHFVPVQNLPSLPPQASHVNLWQKKFPLGMETGGPEFIISIPLEDFEHVHERRLSEEVYQHLVDGSLGYRQAALIQTPSLFRDRPATFVNPPVRIFMREDVWKSRQGVPASSRDRSGAAASVSR